VIRRLENTFGIWIEYRKTPQHYEWRDNHHTWSPGYAITMEHSIRLQLKNSHWKEVTSGIDPNDLFPASPVVTMPCPHVYNVATDTCKLCNKNWNEILWDSNGGSKPCCGGAGGQGPYYYTKGAWHQSDCLEVASQKGLPFSQADMEEDYRPVGSKKGLCTCGSAAVGSDRHSSWCDTK